MAGYNQDFNDLFKHSSDIIDENTIRRDIYERGNASLKYRTWDSPVVKMVVYDQYHS